MLPLQSNWAKNCTKRNALGKGEGVRGREVIKERERKNRRSERGGRYKVDLNGVRKSMGRRITNQS